MKYKILKILGWSWITYATYSDCYTIHHAHYHWAFIGYMSVIILGYLIITNSNERII